MSKPMPRYHTMYSKREYIDLYQDLYQDIPYTDKGSFLCILGSFLKVQVLNGWYFLGLSGWYFLGVGKISNIFLDA